MDATILVVDNDRQVRKLIVSILTSAGYRVLAASGGDQALVEIQQRAKEIDLLITDIVMPGLGGADVYAALKAERPEAEVLFVSGFMSRAPLPGSFLQKPFTVDQLLERVTELLQVRARGTAGSSSV